MQAVSNAHTFLLYNYLSYWFLPYPLSRADKQALTQIQKKKLRSMCFGTAWVTCYALSKVLSKLNISIEIKKSA